MEFISRVFPRLLVSLCVWVCENEKNMRNFPAAHTWMYAIGWLDQPHKWTCLLLLFLSNLRIGREVKSVRISSFLSIFSLLSFRQEKRIDHENYLLDFRPRCTGEKKTMLKNKSWLKCSDDIGTLVRGSFWVCLWKRRWDVERVNWLRHKMQWQAINKIRSSDVRSFVLRSFFFWLAKMQTAKSAQLWYVRMINVLLYICLNESSINRQWTMQTFSCVT